MSDKSGIEWTDATWNPITGCNKVSEGCKNCYAERMALRLQKMGAPRYTNGFKVTPHPDVLEKPLHWTRPRRIFVNSMSDLFHPDVSDEFIRAVWTTMAMAPQHTFQVLTKRPRRMFELLDAWEQEGLTLREGYGSVLPNVWLGVSVENQRRADERIPHLMQTPAAVRFLSCEPLLGPIELDGIWGYPGAADSEQLAVWPIHWVIAGGESGPGACPMDAEWARSLRDQCATAGVPFFFKQWGGQRTAQGGHNEALLDGELWKQMPNAG